MNWFFPLLYCNGIPTGSHPGAFGVKRKYDIHTGVDLYCEDQQPVFAVEDGKVVKKDIFTGSKIGFPWWEETEAVMIEGNSGVVNYGEITTPLKINQLIKKGEQIGNVKRVLFKDKKRSDIIGHSTSMLHLELYIYGSRDFALWEINADKPKELLNPTLFLMKSNEKKFPIIEGEIST